MKKTKKPKKTKKRSITSLKRELWKYVSLYVKQRDGYRCFTCDKYVQGSNAQCGHFVPSSLCNLEMRYDAEWLRTQCMACNIWKSGNYVTFRERLVVEKGEEAVREFEQRRHKIVKDFDYVAQIQHYKALVDNSGWPLWGSTVTFKYETGSSKRIRRKT